MSAYLVFHVSVQDWSRYREYQAAARMTLGSYGGTVLAAQDASEVLEGDDQGLRTVLVEFPSADDARRWYHSPDYQAARSIRLEASSAEGYLVDGLPSADGGDAPR